MMTLIKNCLWCAVLLLSLQFGAAQVPSQMGFDFDASTYPAWDLSGGYVLNQPVIGAGGTEVPMSYSVYIQHDSNGRLTGSGGTMVAFGDQWVAASYTVNGSVSGGGNHTRANFSVRLTGRDWFFGIVRKFNIHVSYRLNVQSDGLTLSGTARGGTSISGVGSDSIKSNVDLPLPTGVDGSWSVNVNVLALRNITGAGSIDVSSFKSPELPGGWPAKRVLPSQASGSYRASKKLVNLSVQGIDEGRGNNVSLKFQLVQPPEQVPPLPEQVPTFPQRMSGRVLGQSINMKW